MCGAGVLNELRERGDLTLSGPAASTGTIVKLANGAPPNMFG